MKKELLGTTKNNLQVFLSDQSSHAATHLAHNPKLLEAVKKAIPTIEDTNDVIRVQIDTGEVIGTTDLLLTTQEDDIVYAKRVARSTYSRFVKNKQPTPTSTIVVDIRHDRNSPTDYFLYTTYIGPLTPSFPGGNYLPEQSIEFWSTHALVWGTQEIIPGSETTICPW